MDWVDKKLERIGYKVYRETDDSIYYILKPIEPSRSGVIEYVLSIDFNDSWGNKCYVTSWGNTKDLSGMIPIGLGLKELRLLYFKVLKMRFKRWVKKVKVGFIKSVFKPGRERAELLNDLTSYEKSMKNRKTVEFYEKEKENEDE